MGQQGRLGGTTTASAVAVVLAVLALLVATPPAAAAPSTGEAGADAGRAEPARRMRQLIDAERAAAGLAPLRWNATLAAVGTDWAGRMAQAGGISHRPDLDEVITSRWRRLGENVGVGADVALLHDAFMASSSHRRNVLGAWDQVGVGIHVDGRRTWVAVNFGAGVITTTTVGGGDATEAGRAGATTTSVLGGTGVAVASGPSGTAGRFVDVAVDGTHAPGIAGVVEAGVSVGCAARRFCPATTVTRGQMASFVARAAGLPTSRGSRLGDVADGSPHDGAVAAVAAAGLMAPCAPDRFCPAEPVTRAAMAGILARLLGLDTPPGATRFADVEDPAVAGAVASVAAAGITTGCDAQRYCPTATVTRGQMASFLDRALAHRDAAAADDDGGRA